MKSLIYSKKEESMQVHNIVFTGRFQPLHNGHVKMLENIKRKYPDSNLIICIIRNSENIKTDEEKGSFHFHSQEKHIKKNNPLPNRIRFKLLNILIKSNPIFSKTVVLMRDRPDTDWAKSLQGLPKDRTIVLPSYGKEEFDRQKCEYYKLKGEKLIFIDIDEDMQYSATAIREKLKKGDNRLSFMPTACHDYFNKYCLKYFA